jgi:hypothetical protein
MVTSYMLANSPQDKIKVKIEASHELLNIFINGSTCLMLSKDCLLSNMDACETLRQYLTEIREEIENACIPVEKD